MCTSVSPACMYVYHMACAWCPRRPKTGMRLPKLELLGLRTTR